MATPKKSVTYDPTKSYLVTVDKVVKINGLIIRPKSGATLSGSLAEEIKDSIVLAEPI